MKYKESQFNLAKSSGCSLILGFLVFSLSFFISYEGLAMQQDEEEKIDRSLTNSPKKKFNIPTAKDSDKIPSNSHENIDFQSKSNIASEHPSKISTGKDETEDLKRGPNNGKSGENATQTDLCPAIELPEDDILLLKAIASRTYEDAAYDHNPEVILEHSRKVIKGITWDKFPFKKRIKADSSIGAIYYSKEPQALIVAFHGSYWADDWIDDFNAFHSPATSLSPQLSGNVHRGFSTVVNDCYDDLRQQMRQALGRELSSKDPVFFTGHSLGGALAILSCAKLAHDEIPFGDNHLKVVSFSAPRGVIGDSAFEEALYKRISRENILCFSNLGDVVPYVPQQIVTYLYPYKPMGLIIEITPTEKLIAYYTQSLPTTLQEAAEHNSKPLIIAALKPLMKIGKEGPAFVLEQYFRIYHGIPDDEPIKIAYKYAQDNYRNPNKPTHQAGEVPWGSVKRFFSFPYKVFHLF